MRKYEVHLINNESSQKDITVDASDFSEALKKVLESFDLADVEEMTIKLNAAPHEDKPPSPEEMSATLKRAVALTLVQAELLEGFVTAKGFTSFDEWIRLNRNTYPDFTLKELEMDEHRTRRLLASYRKWQSEKSKGRADTSFVDWVKSYLPADE